MDLPANNVWVSKEFAHSVAIKIEEMRVVLANMGVTFSQASAALSKQITVSNQVPANQVRGSTMPVTKSVNGKPVCPHHKLPMMYVAESRQWECPEPECEIVSYPREDVARMAWFRYEGELGLLFDPRSDRYYIHLKQDPEHGGLVDITDLIVGTPKMVKRPGSRDTVVNLTLQFDSFVEVGKK